MYINHKIMIDSKPGYCSSDYWILCQKNNVIKREDLKARKKELKLMKKISSFHWSKVTCEKCLKEREKFKRW